MRDIDLDQFWPRPPRLPAERAAVSDAGNGDALAAYLAHRQAEPPPRALTDHDRGFDCSAAIAEALAASAGWAAPSQQIHDSAAGTLPEAERTDDVDPEQLLLDLQLHDAVDPSAVDDPAPAHVTAPSPAMAETLTASAHPRDTATPRPRHRDYRPALWGGAGFIAGALVWHTVGFWIFLSDVVLNANDPRARTLEAFLPNLASSPAQAQKAMSRIPESAVAAAPAAFKDAAAGAQFACVSLALDRSAGLTNAQTCKGSPADLRDAGFNRRTDRIALRPRLQDPVAWTDTTAVVQVSEAAPGSEASTAEPDRPLLTDAELKLDLD
jgi:hypothetical protein